MSYLYSTSLEGQNIKTMLANGFYKSDKVTAQVLIIEDQECRMEVLGNIGQCSSDTFKGTWATGDFGPAHPEIQDITGKSNYDVQMTMMGGIFTLNGVLGQDGKSLMVVGFYKDVEQMTWISQDEVKAIQEAGDPVEAPSCPHNLNPGSPGKLIWLTGPPGAGKSTTGHTLSKLKNFVFYEGDCFFMHTNPYVPLDVNPTDALMKQKPLKGMSKTRLEAAIKGTETFMDITKGLNYEKAKYMYEEMAKDILKEKQRIGGDWVVAQAVPSKALRDEISKILGKDVIHVTLNLSKEAQKKRLVDRHGDADSGIGDYFQLWHDIYELVDEKKENGFTVEVTTEMGPDDVVQSIWRKLVDF